MHQGALVRAHQIPITVQDCLGKVVPRCPGTSGDVGRIGEHGENEHQILSTHNPEVLGSNPSPATKNKTAGQMSNLVSSFFYILMMVARLVSRIRADYLPSPLLMLLKFATALTILGSVCSLSVQPVISNSGLKDKTCWSIVAYSLVDICELAIQVGDDQLHGWTERVGGFPRHCS